MVWFDLDEFCKIKKKIRKTEKEKKKRKEKDKRPRGTHSAQHQKRSTAHPAKFPKGYPFSLFPSLTRGTHPSARLIFKLQPEIPPETEPLPVVTPPLNSSLTPAVSSSLRAYIKHSPFSPFPPWSRSWLFRLAPKIARRRSPKPPQ
jgi:hypothetical protein